MMAGPASNYGRTPKEATKPAAPEHDVHVRMIDEDFSFREAYLENLYPWHSTYMASHGRHLWPCVGESSAPNHAQPTAEQKARGWKCLCGKVRTQPQQNTAPVAETSSPSVALPPEQET